MRAIEVERPGSIRLVEVPDPVPEPGEALIAVGACGICGTDLHIVDGEFPPSPYPIVPGHEAAGTVVSAPGGSGFAEGDRVAIDPSLFCGACEFCRAGRGNLCSRWQAIGDTRDGALAEYVRVPVANLYSIPDDMDFGAAALIEPVSCAVHALDRLTPCVGDRVLVCGAGTMGLIMASLLRAAGAADVVLVDRREQRLGVAGALGFGEGAASIDALRARVGGDGFDKVVDATGVPTVIEEAIGAVRKGGTMMVFGVAPPGSRVAIDPFRIYNEEISIVGSMAVLASYGRAVDLVANGTVDAGAIVSHRYGLDDFEQAYTDARHGAGLKVQIVPTGP